MSDLALGGNNIARERERGVPVMTKVVAIRTIEHAARRALV